MPEIWWAIFADAWSVCDATWKWYEWLGREARRVGPHPSVAVLPDDFTATVYRGGSRERIAGAISWTTSIEVARTFARGHRGIAVPDPVIATASVTKPDIYWMTDDRDEAEVLCLPRSWTIMP